jgi:predicted DCC family thiol-disulfide oxidoreductase YuxK
VKQRQTAYPLAIYYDKSCPLCAEEMHTLKKYDAHERLVLIDCSSPDFADADARAAGIKNSDLMRRIHARDAAGNWLDGVVVFEMAYGAVGINGVARLWGYPRLQLLWDRIYMWIARNRMWLSWLGLNKVYGQFVKFAARRAERRSVPCAGKGSCPINNSPD